MIMALLTFCLILAVTLILGSLFVLFNKSNMLSLAVKTLAPLSCLLLALVSANLTSAFGGYTIFVCIGLGIIVAVETYAAAQKEEGSKAFLSAANLLAIISFVAAGLLLSQINLFALGLGALLGVSVACIVMVFKNQGALQNTLTCLNVIFAFTMLGEAVALLMSGTILPAVFFTLSAVLVIASNLLKLFGNGKVFLIITNILRVLSLITIAASIYFL